MKLELAIIYPFAACWTGCYIYYLPGHLLPPSDPTHILLTLTAAIYKEEKGKT
jgi:hypothetical protein